MSSSRSFSAREAREALGLRLREIRIGAGLTGRALAQRARWDGSKASKIEHGKQAPTPDDIRAWCEHCDAVDQVTDLVASLHVVESMYVEWRRRERAGLRHVQRSYVPLYERTRLFRIYEPGVIPGLLQTRAYAAARMRRIAAFSQLPNDIDQAAAARIGQQRILDSGDHRFVVVLEEWALRSRIGTEAMMVDQLKHLAGVSVLPSVSLGIIPTNIDRAMWSSAGFWIFDDERVSVETPTAELSITQPREIAIYIQTFAELAHMAVYGQSALAMVTAAIDGFNRLDQLV